MKKKIIPIQKITDCVCQYFNVSHQQLFEPNRQESIIYRRQVLAHLCYRLNKGNLSYREIADYFNFKLNRNSNHTTILNNVRAIDKLINVYPDVLCDVKEITNMVQFSETLNKDNQITVDNLIKLIQLNKSNKRRVKYILNHYLKLTA